MNTLGNKSKSKPMSGAGVERARVSYFAAEGALKMNSCTCTWAKEFFGRMMEKPPVMIMPRPDNKPPMRVSARLALRVIPTRTR